MKKENKNSVNLAALDIARLSKGIHRYLKSKGCENIKLGWINEGIARSFGFNNQRDFLKYNKTNSFLVMEKQNALKIVELCFQHLDISGFMEIAIKMLFLENGSDISKIKRVEKIFPEDILNDIRKRNGSEFKSIINIFNQTMPNKNINTNNFTIQKILIALNILKKSGENKDINIIRKESLYYILSKDYEYALQLFSEISDNNVSDSKEELNYIKALYSFMEEIENYGEDHKVTFSEKIICELIKNGVELEKIKLKNNKKNNLYFINLKVPFLIISEENSGLLDVDFIMKRNMEYIYSFDDMISIANNLSELKINLNLLKKNDFDLLGINPDDIADYILFRDGRPENSMWGARAINMLIVLVKTFSYKYKRENKRLMLNDFIAEINYDHVVRLINYFEKEESHESILMLEMLQELMASLPGEDGSEEKREQFGYLYIEIIKKITYEQNLIENVFNGEIKSEIFNLLN